MFEQPWHVLKVKSRCERKVESRLKEKGFQAIAPVQTQIRRWSDRLKKVEVVLFTGYVFVSGEPAAIKPVFQEEGQVLGFLQFENKPAVLREPDVHFIKSLAKIGTPVTILPACPTPGERIEIIAGPLRGYTGVVAAHAGCRRVRISIPSLQCVAQVDIGAEVIRRI
jgi:transcription antitermination factor NusG